MSNLLTKEEAMKKFGLDDIRKFNTKDFIKIMSSLDRMDPVVAKELISQIPNFLNFAKDSLTTLEKFYNKILDSDDESIKSIYANYDLLIKTLNEDLQKENLTDDEKFERSNRIHELIIEKKELHKEQQQFKLQIFKTAVGGIVAISGIVIAALSGTSLTKTNSDNLHHEDYYS